MTGRKVTIGCMANDHIVVRPFVAWIAVTKKGDYLWFLGTHRTRKSLRELYYSQFNHHLEQGGYRAVKVFADSNKKMRATYRK